MITNTEKRKNVMFCLIGVLISTLILLISFSVSKIYPFGDNTLIYNDLQLQYYDLCGYLRNVIGGKDDIFYSFNMGMGMGTIATIAYYLASPFNILFVFTNETNLISIITIVIVLKILACVPTSYIYLVKRYKISSKCATLLSVAYSMMEFNVQNNSNLMWLDALIILPIVALGIYQLINKNRTILYFLSLFYAVLFTYYTGYIICIFAVGFFILEEIIYAIDNGHVKNNLLADVLSFAIVSILACFATSLILIPNIIQTIGHESTDLPNMLRMFKFLEGYKDLFLNNEKVVSTGTAPAIFVGSLPLVLLGGIVLPRRIKLSKRILCIAVLLIGMLTFYIAPVNYAFSMFKSTNSYYFRHSFVYSFLLISLAGYYISNAEYRKWDYIKSGLFISAFALVTKIVAADTGLLWSAIIPITIGVLLDINKTNVKEGVSVVILILLFAVIGVEHITDWTMELKDHTFSRTYAVSYDEDISRKIQAIKSMDEGLYRIDKMGTRFNDYEQSSCNIESANFGYSSLSNYLSTRRDNIGDFMVKMGYTIEPKIELYDCIQPIDNIMGVKYIISKNMPEGYELLDMDSNGIGTYKNPYILPVAVEYNNDFVLEEGNPFDNHRKLIDSIGLQSKDIYINANIESISTENATLNYRFVANVNGPMYCYIMNGADGTTISVEGNPIRTNSWYSNQIVYIGDYNKGDAANISITGGDITDYEIFGCSIDVSAMKNAFAALRDNKCSIIDMSKGRLEIDYEAASDASIMVTIPYESGWKVKVNGRETVCNKVGNTFIGIDIEEGNNNIILEYHPRGFAIGIIISAVSIIAYCIYESFERRKRVA